MLAASSKRSEGPAGAPIASHGRSKGADTQASSDSGRRRPHLPLRGARRGPLRGAVTAVRSLIVLRVFRGPRKGVSSCFRATKAAPAWKADVVASCMLVA